MRERRIFFTLWLALAGFLAHSAALAAPKIEHWQEKNGAQIYWMHVPNLPILDLQIDIDAGSKYDSKVGQAQAFALMMGKGVNAIAGDRAMDEDAINEAWGDMAAQWTVGAHLDRWSFSVRSLDTEAVRSSLIPLMARQLAAPSLPPAMWQQEQTKWVNRLKQAQLHPASLAQETMMRALYPAHPYGNTETVNSVQSIHPLDLKRWHQRFIRPCHMRISIVSALPKESIQQMVSSLLRPLPQACSSLPKVRPVDEIEPALKAIQQQQIFPSEQTHILLATRSVARSDPDFFPLLVGNHILGGGGFASLLTQRVREQKGLSYSVTSAIVPLGDRGYFLIGLETRPDQAKNATQIARETLEEFLRLGPSEDALDQAKLNLIQGWPSRMDSNAKLLGMLSNIAWNDLPHDYLEHWTQRVEAVSALDIQAAFRRAIDARALVEVSVGPDASKMHHSQP